MGVFVKQATEEDIPFLAACGHTEDDQEIHESVRRKVDWFKKQWKMGLISLMGIAEGKKAGCLNIFPIENCPWGPKGEDLLVMPCLFVTWDYQGKGLGKALIERAIEIAKSSERKGLVVFGFSDPDWFLPVTFFKRFGFEEVSQNGDETLMWLKFVDDAIPPDQLVGRYRFSPVVGKVVVDLFFNEFCQTSDIEAQRVKEVAGEFGDRVVLNVYNAGDYSTREEHELSRGIFVNGRELFWGYEAPREGIREALREALVVVESEHS